MVNFFIASSLGKKPSPQSGAAINLSLSIYLKTAFILCRKFHSDHLNNNLQKGTCFSGKYS